jgi:hypothetical protein
MSKHIYCCQCNKYCGEIRDAKLIVGLKFLCKDCETIIALSVDSRTQQAIIDQVDQYLAYESERWKDYRP